MIQMKKCKFRAKNVANLTLYIIWVLMGLSVGLKTASSYAFSTIIAESRINQSVEI